MSLTAATKRIPQLWMLSAWILAIIVLTCVVVSPAMSQTPVTVIRDEAIYQFGQSIQFTLALRSEQPISEATLLFSTPEMPSTQSVKVPLVPGSSLTLTQKIDLKQVQLTPFSVVTWYWDVTDLDGNRQALPEQTILYRDDRFLWHSRARANAIVYWTDGDITLGQTVLDIVDQSLSQIQAIIPAQLSDPVQIYLYPTSSDLQEAMRLTGYQWVGGHSAVELGVILIALPSRVMAEAELRQTIPHELTHLLMSRATGGARSSVPAWFDEGMATYFELDDSPNRQSMLQAAIDNDQLLRLKDLCLSFPHSEEKAVIAYSESGSLVSMIQSVYGNHALTELVLAHADGSGCEAAVKRVLGISLAELEAEWRETSQSSPTLERLLRKNGWWLLLALAGFGVIALLVWAPSPNNNQSSYWRQDKRHLDL